jgi:AraC family transcriptional regulator
MASLRKSRSFDDWLGDIPVQPQKSSLSLDWSLVSVQTITAFPTSDYHAGPQIDEVSMPIIFSGEAQCDVNINEFNKSHQEEVFRTGVMSIVPKATVFESRWDKTVYSGIWRFQPHAISQLGGELLRSDPDKIELPFIFKMLDPLIFQLALAMLHELEQLTPKGSLYADTLASTMIMHILQTYSKQPKRNISAKGQLSPEQKYQLEDYIDSYLTQKITLHELANLVHLSISHLNRLFVASFGMPVYKYVTYKRVERAKAMLLANKHTLLEVAVQCGFANQSHFNHQFKAIVGISPKQFIQQAS